MDALPSAHTFKNAGMAGYGRADLWQWPACVHLCWSESITVIGSFNDEML